jgi:hypothetical protein
MDDRLRALCDLSVPGSREFAGVHDYDGEVQDLSPAGVAAGLAALGGAPSSAPYSDPHDEAHVAASEDYARVLYGEVQWHRRNPLVHVANLELSCYDRAYAPAGDRADARWRHLARWPEAVDAALESLDAVAAPVASACLGPVRGLVAGLDSERSAVEAAAVAAHAELEAHVRAAAAHGDPSAALGEATLARLLGSAEAMEVDLAALRRIADTERDRLRAMLDEGCGRLRPGVPVGQVIPELLADHPDTDGVLEEARALTAEVIAWTAEHQLVPYDDGECLVGPAPESRHWAMAMMAWAAPAEPEGPSWFHVTPPGPSWPRAEQEEWLAVFSRTTLPAIAVHEVAPGHFSHGRALRRAPTEARRLLLSEAFLEGWAHYVEELAVEEGFRATDPRFAVGVALEGLVRVTRLACAIGVHTGEMSVDEAAARFRSDAFLQGPAALSEAQRATFDPTYGRYTWGKLAIRDLRRDARHAWGGGFTLRRFHSALLELGSPPLGLLRTAVERG